MGGLVGDAFGLDIVGSYATGTVRGVKWVGGLAGDSSLSSVDGSGSVTASYATGSVTATEHSAGGLLGRGSVPIAASYALGTIVGEGDLSSVGGLVGTNTSASITDSYYNTDVGVINLGSGGINTFGTGKTTSELITPTAPGMTPGALYYQWNRNAAGAVSDDPAAVIWDFGTDAQYPALRVDFNDDGVATVAEFGNQPLDLSFDPTAPVLSFAAAGTTVEESLDLLPVPSEIALNVSHGGFTTERNFTLTVSAAQGTIAAGDCTLSVLPGSEGTLTSSGAFTYTLTVPAFVPVVRLGFLPHDADFEEEILILTLSASDSSLIGTVPSHAIAITDIGDDHSALPSRATPISVAFPGGDAVLTGQLHRGDTDCFSFTVPEPGLLTVYTTSSINTAGWLFDAAQTQLSYDNDSGQGSNFRFSLSLSGQGGRPYFIRVQGFHGVEFGSYPLHVEFLPDSANYDTDRDGLIEVRTLSQLDALRCDLDGDGRVVPEHESIYGAAFPSAAGGTRYAPLFCLAGCRGYELMVDLDFEDANGDGTANDKSIWAQGAVSAGVPGAEARGWLPIWHYTGVFEGNFHLIRNLYINGANRKYSGLFARLSDATVRHLGPGGCGYKHPLFLLLSPSVWAVWWAAWMALPRCTVATLRALFVVIPLLRGPRAA